MHLFTAFITKKYNVGVAFHINGKMFVQTIK